MELPEDTHLYKYYAYNENSLSVLINKKIWIAKPESFNDPFDCRIEFEDITDDNLLKWIFKQMDRGTKQSERTKQYATERLNRTIDKHFKNVGLFCMSEFKDNILMWSHYADKHRGFCIEFTRDSDNYLGDIYRTIPINYVNEYSKMKLIDSTGEVYESVFYKYFFTKAKDWEYEGEWRCFYHEGGREVSMPTDISSVIFGLEMTEQHENTIKNILLGQGVRYKKAVKTANQFKIDVIDLPK